MQVLKCDHCGGIMRIVENEWYSISVYKSDEGDKRQTAEKYVHLCHVCYVNYVKDWLEPNKYQYIEMVRTSDEIAVEHYDSHDSYVDEE